MRSCSYPAPLAASRGAQALPGPRTRPAVSDVSAERSDQDDHRFRHPQPRPVSSPSRRLANEKSSQSDTRIGACRAGWPTAALRSARVHHDLLRLRPRVGAPALMSFGSAGCGPACPGAAAGDERGACYCRAPAARDRITTSEPVSTSASPAAAPAPRSAALQSNPSRGWGSIRTMTPAHFRAGTTSPATADSRRSASSW